MSSTADLAIPRGALVVVTGANGFIASHVVDQLLLAGYHVRGTVRNTKRADWMIEYFNTKYGAGKFDLVEVQQMADPGAFDNAVQGASGVIHLATPVMQSYDPNEAVPMVVQGALNALKAAAKEPLVRRVVMTSSSTAAASPVPNVEFVIDEKTWNDEAVKAAWAPPPYEGEQRKLDVYSATQYYVNVQDTARVHVGALIYPDVQSERLFAFAHPFNWNDILASFRKLYPEHHFIDDIPDLGRDLSRVANGRAEEIVKRFGRAGWTSLEESIRDATLGWAASEK